VRVLAADLGRALGGGAHLRALRRTAIGPFGLADAKPVDAIELLPPAEALRGHPSLTVDAATAALVAHGRVLERAAMGDPEGDGPWAVLDQGGELLAVYEAHRGDTVKPAVVLA
jgi:tRNA pseudouridine55 synthase